MFAPGEADDVKQAVAEGLLKRMESIRAHFNGSTLVRTYLSVIIRNICLEIRRSTGTRPQTVLSMPDDESLTAGASEDPDNQALIGEVISTFHALLMQYGRNAPKILLMLKLRFRLPVSTADILKWYPGCSRENLDAVLGVFGGDYESMPDHEVYRSMTPVMNEAEGKLNSSDALRKWTSAKIAEVLELLNGTPPVSTHTEETLKILLEDQVSPFLLRR